MKSNFEQEKTKTIGIALGKWLLHTWERVVSLHYPTEYLSGKIPKPVIQLMPGMSQLGLWRGSVQNTIAIQYELAMNHPWYAVLDVFLHEVAHQLREVLFPERVEPIHGPTFRSICHTIGANPAASSSMTELDARIFSEQEEKLGNDSLISKIRKLLNLAQNATENEAEVALCKAQLLMAKHGLSDEDLDCEDTFVTISVGTPVSKTSYESNMLANILSEFWAVQCIWIYVPDIERYISLTSLNTEPPPLQILTISGTVTHVRIASYVYDFIQHYIFRNYAEAVTKGICKHGVRARRDFAIGVLSALRDRLRGQSENQETYALIHAGDTELNSYFWRRFPSQHKNGGHSVKINQAAVNAGKAAGEKLQINPGLETSSKSPRQLKQ